MPNTGVSAPSKAPSVARGFRAGGPIGRSVGRYATALDGLKPEGKTVTRGANESRVYQAASPSVVLVISDDSLGSGALISADGKIITNLHVVEDKDEVGVIFKPKVEGASISKADVRMAKVIRRDEVADLALLQVSSVPEGVKPLAVGGASAVQIGSDVHAIGHPTGEAWTYTRGIVSQIRKDYAWHAEDKIEHRATVIQTQTPINPGNSGGPLIDDQVEIVGINSFISEGEGLNFAVSADDVKAFLARSGDRTVAPSAKVKTAAGKGECEIKSLGEQAIKDPVGKEYVLDVDCDGKGDVLMVEPADKKEPLMYAYDDNGDGKLDSYLYDDGRDGHFDLALYDTDGNGKADLKGEFKNGEDDPYRLERIEEE